VGIVEELLQAREAYERRDWIAAYDGLSDLESDDLSGADFAELATAAFLLGRTNDCVLAMQRAFQAHRDAGEDLAAARCAFWLAKLLLTHGEPAVGGGWVSRAQHLVDARTDDPVERGYVKLLQMFQSLFSGDFGSVGELAAEVQRYGEQHDDPDLLAMGLSARGRMMMYTGQVSEGLSLLDEAMVGVAAGEVSPVFAGEIYCLMIEACQEVSDFGRAAEWTSMLARWCDSQRGLVPYTGQCAVHRGQIMRVRGAYPQALDEFARAVERYEAAEFAPAVGLAWAERAEVLRIRGEHDASEAAYERAASYGHDTQPGHALLWLNRGRTAAAVAAVRRLLSEPRDPVHRSQLLPASVEVLLAEGAVDEAATVARELAALAESFGCAALQAMAERSGGHVLLVQGEHATAVPALRRAARIWGALDAPYEVARCRLLLGQAFRALGDVESGRAELEGARAAFVTLGAVPAEQEAAQLLAPTAPGGLTAREVEVLRLVASGKSNPAIAAALVLSEKTVARHLSNIFNKLGVTSRTAAAAFAFEHHLV
jgi:ATP/maltotriose-dependent transcriptional regulator MalT